MRTQSACTKPTTRKHSITKPTCLSCARAKPPKAAPWACCTHHSQAAGGQPRNGKIRALSWVVTRWAGQAAPRVITLENVKQITKWGPLVAKRDKASGRVIKTDGSIAAPGEVVPVSQQYLIPNPKKAGQTWRAFVRSLQNMGYTVEWRTFF